MRLSVFPSLIVKERHSLWNKRYKAISIVTKSHFFVLSCDYAIGGKLYFLKGLSISSLRLLSLFFLFLTFKLTFCYWLVVALSFVLLLC